MLQDAIKCNFEDWRVWENYVVISCDVKQFSEVIRGIHRLLDMKRKWTDEKVSKVSWWYACYSQYSGQEVLCWWYGCYSLSTLVRRLAGGMRVTLSVQWSRGIAP